jgi:hypothetical protein
MQALERRFDLVPIEEVAIEAAPMLQFVDTQCVSTNAVYVGTKLAPCKLKLGWYRPVPRTG